MLFHNYLVTAGAVKWGISMTVQICGGMHFTIDGFRAVYVCIALFMWSMALLFSPEYMKGHANKARYYVFMILTGVSTIGVFLSADLYTLFIFFEMMSFTSYVWVAQEETKEALSAAKTYLAVAVIGGLVMLMGIFLLQHETGTLEIEALGAGQMPEALLLCTGFCLLFGFGAKAGAFPLHIWLPKAHPVAPAPASALLSGILTKTGVFGILIVTTRLFMGNEIWGNTVLWIGVITMFLGALLAVFSIDLKRTLACSSMSQIGFILAGTGALTLLEEENFLASQGVFLHMINHSLIKLVLFLLAGAVYMKTHALDLNRIRGFGRNKPFLHVVFLIGALSIMGIPSFSGYVSKTLLHESLVVLQASFAEAVFLLSGGLTIAYCTKLYVAIFVQKNQDEDLQRTYDEKKKLSVCSYLALGLSSGVLFCWGRVPVMTKVGALCGSFFRIHEDASHVSFFSPQNLKGALISIVIGTLVYALIFLKEKRCQDSYTNVWPKRLDLENLIYRPLLFGVLAVFFTLISRVLDSLADSLIVLLRKTVYKDAAPVHIRKEGTVLTELLGKLLNAWNQGWYHFFSLSCFDDVVTEHYREKRRLASQKNYVHKLACFYEDQKEDFLIIQRSLSFGLFLFCIGLTLTLIYLIWF